MTLQKLPETVTGTREVKGTDFLRVYENEKGYIYKALSESKPYFEVFKKKSTPLCVDFEKRIYSETEFKEVYPKDKDFGVWAWTVESLEQGINKLGKI